MSQLRITSVTPVGAEFDLPAGIPRGVLITLAGEDGIEYQLSLTVQEAANVANRLNVCVKEAVAEG